AMMSPIIQLLHDAGVPSEKIKWEEFIAAQRAETATSPGIQPKAQVSNPPPNDTEPTLTLTRSGKSLALDPNKVLLEIAEDAGVNLNYECRSGICGRCKTRLLSGQVTMETQDALTNEEKAKNIILMCQARATGHVTVDA